MATLLLGAAAGVIGWIYRGPNGEERASATTTMIAAHAVYGVTTALAEERLR